MLRTSKGLKSGLAWYIRTATPAAPGVAMLVPDSATYPSPVLASGALTLLPTNARLGLTLPSSVGPWLE